MSMAHLLFVRDFEAEIDAERLLAERQVPTHSEADLAAAADAARADGYAAGHAEGLAAGRHEALASIEAQCLAAMQSLALSMADLLADRAAHRQRLEAEMSAFAGDLAERVFPELVQRLGPNRLTEEIGRVVRRAVGSPSLEIRLAPDVAASREADLVAMAAGTGQHIRVVADPALAPADVQAAWRNGRSRYSFAAICRSVLTLIRQTAPLPSAPFPSAPDPAGATHD